MTMVEESTTLSWPANRRVLLGFYLHILFLFIYLFTAFLYSFVSSAPTTEYPCLYFCFSIFQRFPTKGAFNLFKIYDWTQRGIAVNISLMFNLLLWILSASPATQLLNLRMENKKYGQSRSNKKMIQTAVWKYRKTLWKWMAKPDYFIMRWLEW